MDDAIMTIRWAADRPPTLDDAARELSVPLDDLDREFGVQLISRRNRKYAVVYRGEAAREPRANPEEGPFANPRIGVFGLVE
ncbi:hypothetical protein [Salinarimonas chemoclinalis]|uniref:hypothetical protein n=1 Tax=Salinarimonas chemoclinalis TaxID=3241599 RepID=UPI0035587FAC